MNPERLAHSTNFSEKARNLTFKAAVWTARIAVAFETAKAGQNGISHQDVLNVFENPPTAYAMMLEQADPNCLIEIRISSRGYIERNNRPGYQENEDLPLGPVSTNYLTEIKFPGDTATGSINTGNDGVTTYRAAGISNETDSQGRSAVRISIRGGSLSGEFLAPCNIRTSINDWIKSNQEASTPTSTLTTLPSPTASNTPDSSLGRPLATRTPAAATPSATSEASSGAGSRPVPGPGERVLLTVTPTSELTPTTTGVQASRPDSNTSQPRTPETVGSNSDPRWEPVPGTPPDDVKDIPVLSNKNLWDMVGRNFSKLGKSVHDLHPLLGEIGDKVPSFILITIGVAVGAWLTLKITLSMIKNGIRRTYIDIPAVRTLKIAIAAGTLIKTFVDSGAAAATGTWLLQRAGDTRRILGTLVGRPIAAGARGTRNWVDSGNAAAAGNRAVRTTGETLRVGGYFAGSPIRLGWRGLRNAGQWLRDRVDDGDVEDVAYAAGHAVAETVRVGFNTLANPVRGIVRGIFRRGPRGGAGGPGAGGAGPAAGGAPGAGGPGGPWMP